jgi:radical SAM protein (TIGR01212 family)
MQPKPYRDLTDFLSSKFPHRVQKVTINAGFSCPNRDGSKAYGGCTYCNNQSFSPRYEKSTKSITEQIAEGIDSFLRKYEGVKYLPYFQSYTNTYGDLESLVAMYEEALAYPDVVGLVIGTRPDCVSDELLDYLEELNKKTFVLVEYGVESTLDRTLERVNRQHTYEESVAAIRRTANRGILVGAHMILGLPGETREEILHHADELSKLPLTTIKLHQLQIIKGTKMEEEFRQSPESFHLFSLGEYVDLCVDFVERLRPDLYIERFASQSPKDLRVAPHWGVKNVEVAHKVAKRLREKDSWQGKLFRHCGLDP